MKHVDLEKPTTILDQVYLRCTQRECKPNKNLVDEYRKKFASRISGGPTEKATLFREKWCKCYCVVLLYERTCEEMRGTVLRTRKNIEHLCKVSTKCLNDHQVKKEELETVGELSKVCSQIALKSLYLERIGRPDILWVW